MRSIPFYVTVSYTFHNSLILCSYFYFFFSIYTCYFLFFFFFQAEDGIRDLTVTGVQTCALPILLLWRSSSHPLAAQLVHAAKDHVQAPGPGRRQRDHVDGFSCAVTACAIGVAADRKSTRLNSSHSQISYAVFCLKKKKKVNTRKI